MLKEFVLPRLDSRVVIFGDVVFKLKYKISPDSQISYSNEHHADLEKLTKGILKNLKESNEIYPLRSNCIIIFPGLTPWEIGGRLQFRENGKLLEVYSNTVLLVVHLIRSPSSVSRVSRKRMLDDGSCDPIAVKKRQVVSHCNEKNMALEEAAKASYESSSQITYTLSPANQSFSLSSIVGYIIQPILKLLKWK